MIHELDLPQALSLPVLALLLGLIVGSFANVCIHRIPLGQSIVRPPSRCPKCGALVRAFDNVPVLSWLWLRGRCRACRAPISLRYPLVEALNGALYGGLASVGGLSTWTLVAMPLATGLLVLSLIDLDHHLLPNVITRPGIAAGLLASFLPGWPTKSLESFLAAVGGYLAFWAVARAYQRIRGEEGLGQGDWKMAALIGAFLGWQKLLLVVFVASLLGAVVGMLFIAFRGRDLRFPLPLGTFLGAAGIASLFVGDPLLAWYAAFFRG